MTHFWVANDPIEDRHDEKVTNLDAWFGIYDGHSGTGASEWCKNNLIQYVSQSLKVDKLLTNPQLSFENISETIKKTFIEAFLKAGWKCEIHCHEINNILDHDFFETCLAAKQIEGIRSGACVIMGLGRILSELKYFRTNFIFLCVCQFYHLQNNPFQSVIHLNKQ